MPFQLQQRRRLQPLRQPQLHPPSCCSKAGNLSAFLLADSPPTRPLWPLQIHHLLLLLRPRLLQYLKTTTMMTDPLAVEAFLQHCFLDLIHQTEMEIERVLFFCFESLMEPLVFVCIENVSCKRRAKFKKRYFLQCQA